jgi:transcriptional regulator with XRE-family HTH domain
MAKKAVKAVDLHVGGLVKKRRLALGLTQEKLADRLGITFQQVQKYEKGTNRIGSSRLVQIAESCRCRQPFSSRLHRPHRGLQTATKLTYRVLSI